MEKLNIKYSSGGDYFDEFVNSDAIIHDCSSFMVEYLFVNKPCCFVERENVNKYLSKLGRLCLKCHDIATSEKEIDDFIRKVCSDSYDMHQKDRMKIIKKIKVNYPNVSKYILDILTLK